MKKNKTPAQEPEEELDFASALERYLTPPPEQARPRPRKKEALICDVNLEDGMPLVEDALGRMRMEMDAARRKGYRVVRIIHGYGSSGKGGAIGKAVRKSLPNAIPGEEFDSFHDSSRRLLSRFPELKKDRDYAKGNPGITLVIL